MTSKLAFTTAFASLAFLIVAPASFASTTTSSKTTKSSSTARAISDAQFAKEAAQGGLAEVKLGQLAEQKGTSQEVKDFGKKMETDHSKADEQLKTTASNDKITLPTTLDAKDQAAYDRLSKLSGESFDLAYARAMVRDHRADVATFHREAYDGKDASIKGFASQTLPTLEDHLKEARTMLQEVSKSANNSKSSINKKIKSTSGD